MERIEILYNDANVIVIYKPEGILSVPFSGARQRTASGIVEEVLRKRGLYSQKYKVLPVHRLDRETSGVMMFATNERAQKVFMDNWHSIVKSRKYVALCETPRDFSRFGILPDCGLINDNLFYNAYNVAYVQTESSCKKEKSGKAENKKSVTARTHYKILKHGKKFSLFELELDTGRKNQIRAHLASKGYTICGDINYRSKCDPFERLCLHARTLVYEDPFLHEEKSFEIPEPKEWIEIVK